MGACRGIMVQAPNEFILSLAQRRKHHMHAYDFWRNGANTTVRIHIMPGATAQPPREFARFPARRRLRDTKRRGGFAAWARLIGLGSGFCPLLRLPNASESSGLPLRDGRLLIRPMMPIVDTVWLRLMLFVDSAYVAYCVCLVNRPMTSICYAYWLGQWYPLVMHID